MFRRSRTHAQEAAENRRALSHYQRLQNNFTRILSEARNDTGSNDSIANKLLALEDNIQGIGQYLSFQLDPKFYNEVRGEDSTIAERVLHIPELLELILSFAEIEEIMRMEQVSKSLRDMVKASPRLQIQLFLRPEKVPPNAPIKYRTPDCVLGHPLYPGVYMDADNEQLFIAIEPERGYSSLPRIGSRWKQMLISQPPITSIRVVARCSGCDGQDYSRDEGLTKLCGITLGDLCEIAASLIEEKVECDQCSGDGQGKYPLRTSITFHYHYDENEGHTRIKRPLRFTVRD